MLLADVVTTSAEVGAQSSRLAKVTRIAHLLSEAARDTDTRDQIAVIVSWLSGELPQRQIGVGWAALRSLPAPALAPVLTVTGVDAAFTEIGATAGKGSQARRAALVADLFGAATEAEQTFLRRLLGGELRQGALAGVMADAVARAAGIAAPTGPAGGHAARRSARRRRRGADPRRRRPRTSSRCRSDSRWVRCSRRPPPVSSMRSKSSAAQQFSRPSWTAPGCRSTAAAMTSRSTPAASTTSPPGCPKWSRRRWPCPCTT